MAMTTLLASKSARQGLSPELARGIDKIIGAESAKVLMPLIESISEHSGRDRTIVVGAATFVAPLARAHAAEMLVNISRITNLVMARGKNREGRGSIASFLYFASMIRNVDDRAKVTRGTAETIVNISAKRLNKARIADMLARTNEVGIWLVKHGREDAASSLCGSILPRISSALRKPDAVLEILQTYRKHLGIEDAAALLRKDRKK